MIIIMIRTSTIILVIIITIIEQLGSDTLNNFVPAIIS